MKRTTVASRAWLLVFGLFAISCTESVGPERGRFIPGFSYSANGVTLSRSVGTSGQNTQLLIKGFNPSNPHHGDAIVATFFWPGNTFIIDSVVDVVTTNPYTPVGNKYTLVEYIQAGGYSMATYVATNVQNFPDPNTDGGQVIAVGAYLSQPVSDGALTLAAFSGLDDNFAIALGAHNSKSGSGSSPTSAHADPIAVNAGAVAYTVTMAGLWGLDPPQSFNRIGPGSGSSTKNDAAYAVQSSAVTVDPQWSWFFNSADTWLVTTLALNPATATSPVGNLTATTSTTGSSLDPDGYTVTVDGGPNQPIATNNSTGVAFTDLAAGSHSVALSGVAANCTVSSANPQTVTVPAGGTATAPFTVSCAATTGTLTATTSTTGSSLDPDGYTVTVDGGPNQPIATNNSTGVTFTGLADGSHSVALSGVAANCTVSSANPQTVTVPSGGTATAPFTLSCVTPPGNLTVTTSTTGSSLDPDGYTVTVDGGPNQPIATNNSTGVTFTGLAAGSHSVELSGLAANCTLSSANPQTVTVPAGGTATVAFTLSCVTPPGNLTVTTSTTGSSLDPDGYTVTADGGPNRPIATNNSTGVTFTGLTAGSHSVALSGVAANCTVSSANPQTVTVPAGGTATVAFTLSCVTPPGNLTVTTSTTGSSLDPDGYTVTADGGPNRPIATNNSTGVTFTGLTAGSHSVALSGVAANCTVSSANPQTV